MADRIKGIPTMTTRQKATIGIFIIIVLVLLWQGYKLFAERRSVVPAPRTVAAKPATNTVNRTAATSTTATPGVASATMTPNQTQLIKPTVTTANEAELSRLQQDTQIKYITAINELQMLRVSRDIAETNQAIMDARLSAVTAQKKILDLLSPPPPPPAPAAVSTVVTPVPTVTVQPALGAGQGNEQVNYVVISVAQLQYRWSAVIGAKGVLYNVHVGDVLPPDRSRVAVIDRTGVVLIRNGVRRKISMVPII